MRNFPLLQPRIIAIFPVPGHCFTPPIAPRQAARTPPNRDGRPLDFVRRLGHNSRFEPVNQNGRNTTPMAHARSAKKRIQQNLKERARNRWRKSRVKTSVKAFDSAIHDGDVGRAEQAYRELTKSMDQVAETGTIHKNQAARRKSRLAKRLNALKAQAAA